MISGIISVILPKEQQSEIPKTCKMISGKTRRQTKVLPVFRGVSLWIVIMVSPESTNFYDNANGKDIVFCTMSCISNILWERACQIKANFTCLENCTSFPAAYSKSSRYEKLIYKKLKIDDIKLSFLFAGTYCILKSWLDS